VLIPSSLGLGWGSFLVQGPTPLPHGYSLLRDKLPPMFGASVSPPVCGSSLCSLSLPTGTMLDDVTHSGCLPLAQCPCTHGGHTYAPGDSFSTSCSSW
jgi:hypothetical protein